MESLRAVHKETHAALAACGPETHDIANHDHAEAEVRFHAHTVSRYANH